MQLIQATDQTNPPISSDCNRYRGRFAPSPTGSLHLGSLFTAVASFVDARSKHGDWALRIDDLDSPRNVAGSTSKILKILEATGLTWDGPVLYQSRQIEKYAAALENLQRQDLVYRCTCSRKYLGRLALKSEVHFVYPGFCRERQHPAARPHALRVKTSGTEFDFVDPLQGPYKQNLALDVGDFIVRRRDGIFAYQLAVVIDDASQGISHVLRGMDLLASTPRQIYLHSLLNLPVPRYIHVPLVVDDQRIKLSKQSGAREVEISDLSRVVFQVLEMLNHAPPQELKKAPPGELLQWAVANWQLGKLTQLNQVDADRNR